MSSKELEYDPVFRCMVRANGQGEVWTNTTDDYKLNQYGWRCTSNENNYELDTVMGNWYEERCDVEQMKRASECLPSHFGHYYNPIYNSSYNIHPVVTVPDVLKSLKRRHPHAYPRHQTEMDSDEMKAIYNSWTTTYRVDYLDPRFRTQPIVLSEKKTSTSDDLPLPTTSSSV